MLLEYLDAVAQSSDLLMATYVLLHRLLQLNIIFNFSMELAYNCRSRAISAVFHCGGQACSGVLRLSSATDRFADSLRVGERVLHGPQCPARPEVRASALGGRSARRRSSKRATLSVGPDQDEGQRTTSADHPSCSIDSHSSRLTPNACAWHSSALRCLPTSGSTHSINSRSGWLASRMWMK
jgi:hypothetical protein